MPYYKVEGIGGFMLLLRAVILALGVLPLPVLAQDAAQLFQPAPRKIILSPDHSLQVPNSSCVV